MLQVEELAGVRQVAAPPSSGGRFQSGTILLPPALHSQGLIASSAPPTVPPTATVQPTLLPLQTAAKPVVGTVSPVRPLGGSSPLYQSYPSLYSGQYVQPGQFPPVQPQYCPAPQPYPAFPFQQFPAFQSGKQAGEQPAVFGSPQGYFIAGPYPQPVVQPTVTSATAAASSQPGPASQPGYLVPAGKPAQPGQHAQQGFLYGPYSYPYGPGRMIGPVIALGLFLFLLIGSANFLIRGYSAHFPSELLRSVKILVSWKQNNEHPLLITN